MFYSFNFLRTKVGNVLEKNKKNKKKIFLNFYLKTFLKIRKLIRAAAYNCSAIIRIMRSAAVKTVESD